MKWYEYIVIDDDGIPIRKFTNIKLAKEYIRIRPEFKILKVSHDWIEEVGECLF